MGSSNGGEELRKLSDMNYFLRESSAMVVHNQDEAKQRVENMESKLPIHDDQFSAMEKNVDMLEKGQSKMRAEPVASSSSAAAAVENTARKQYAALEKKSEAEISRITRIATRLRHHDLCRHPLYRHKQPCSSLRSSEACHWTCRRRHCRPARTSFASFRFASRSRRPSTLFMRAIHVKLSSDLRLYVNMIRELGLTTRASRERVMWAAVQQTRERRARNRCLLRTTEVLQRQSVLLHIKDGQASKLVCWRSATVVLGHKTICTITASLYHRFFV